MSSEILEKNLLAMNKWYPDFVELIREKNDIEDDTEIIIEMSLDGKKIFRIKKEERMLYLEGKRDAVSAVEMWLERLGEIHKYAPVFLFGIGNGDYLKAIIENTEENVNVVIYEPSINIFRRLLNEIDLSDIIENRPIAFIIEGINESEFRPVMNKVLATQNMSFLKEEIHPNYREFYAEKILEKVRILDEKITAIKLSYNVGKRFQKNIAQNVFSNMKYVCEGYNTKQMAAVFPADGTAILVAAGPSLNKNIQEIKKAKNKAFILAVDTVLKPLLNHGIVPDAFVTIDPDKPLELTEIEGAENIPVIAPATAKYALINRQKAKKIFYYDGYELPAHIYKLNGKEMPSTSTGGSVACSGFSALYRMGFKTIILVGQDLAYTDNKSHVDGSFQDKMPEQDTTGMIMVKGNYQDEIPTEGILKKYLDWFEVYIEGIKNYRDVRIVNATEGGAYIKGTELAALRDIIKETCLEEINYSDLINRMEPELTKDDQKKASEYLSDIPQQYNKMKKSAEQMKKAYQQLLKISKNRNIMEKECNKQLKKIKKLSRKLQSDNVLYQLIDSSMSPIEFLVLSEYYYEKDSKEEDLQEAARKGATYSEMMYMCIELLEDLSRELLLDSDKKE